MSYEDESGAAAASATASTTSGGHAAPRRRRSRRREELSLTGDMEEEVSRKIRRTLKNSHSKKTLESYKSYMNSVHEWNVINNVEVCNLDDELDPEQFDVAISTVEGLIPHTPSSSPASSSPSHFLPSPAGFEEQANKFKKFIQTRTHAKLKNADGTPARAKIGSLRGYRSAFAWFVWTRRARPVPAEWDQQMRGYFRGLNRAEGIEREPEHLMVPIGYDGDPL